MKYSANKRIFVDENKLLSMLEYGFSDKEIIDILDIDRKTLATYKHKIHRYAI